jgi:ABC-type sugar transport system substrate-binding protein
MKKILFLVLALLMSFSLACCAAAPAATAEQSASTSSAVQSASTTPSTETSAAASPKTYKIGVMTGTVSQNEEEYRAAEAIKAKYGDMIIQTTYPDNFVKEQETLIANILSMASDPDCKAIVMSQGVPGTCAAIDKMRELRPDIFFVSVTPGEDPAMIASKADLIMQADEYNMGYTMIDQAVKMGAKTFIQYTFPRHMSYPILAARRDLFKANCAKAGIEYVEVTAPDPAGDAGVNGTQQFILEDVPRQIQKYGKDTALYGTNCSMQEPLVKQTVANGGIYILPCCPSPYHGWPAGLGISIPDDKKANIPWILEEETKVIAEKNMTGRMSNWAVPVNMMIIQGAVAYCDSILSSGGSFDKLDEALLKKSLGTAASEMSGEQGVMDIQMAKFNDLETKVEYDNWYMLQEEYKIF